MLSFEGGIYFLDSIGMLRQTVELKITTHFLADWSRDKDFPIRYLLENEQKWLCDDNQI